MGTSTRLTISLVAWGDLLPAVVPQIHTFVSEEILRMEPDEGLEKLRSALKICDCYRDTYQDRRTHLSEYFKEGPVVEWDFQPSLVFARMDRMANQLKIIQVCVGSYPGNPFPHPLSPPPILLRVVSIMYIITCEALTILASHTHMPHTHTDTHIHTHTHTHTYTCTHTHRNTSLQ